MVWSQLVLHVTNTDRFKFGSLKKRIRLEISTACDIEYSIKKKNYFYSEAHMYPSFAVSDILSWGNKNVTQAKKSPQGSLTVFGSSAKYHSESKGIC